MPSATDKSSNKPVVIIGFMGTGKTTVGRLVAKSLGRRFVDLDELVVKQAGKPIADIFRSEGEPGFRQRERAALDQALAESDLVLATGGGAACREDNLSDMLERGRVVALEATPEEVLKRTGSRSGRPLLDGTDDPLAVARDLLGQREPYYARAHHRVDTVGKRPQEVATAVLAALGLKEGNS